MQSIAIDRERNWVTVRTGGFLGKARAEAFCQEIIMALPALGPGLGRHAMICDLSDSGVSPAETIETLRGILTNPAYVRCRARHVVLVTTSALARLQLMRLASVRPGITVCADVAEAQAWVAQQRAKEAVTVT